MDGTSIAVVGAGFSGTLLSLHLLRRCPPTTRVILIERNNQFGRGPAYATGNPGHLLNVPAGRMSAFHDRPRDFLDWLDSQSAERSPSVPSRETGYGAHCFVPRRLFGAYVRHLLNQELKQPGRGDRLELLRGDVLDIDTASQDMTLRLDRDRTVRADMVVLAIGNFPPEPPPVANGWLYDSPYYRADPWAADTLKDLDATAPVLLIGTGLTMVDTVISLLDQGHGGPIHAISRRGLLPLPHGGGPSSAPEAHAYPTALNALLGFLRRETARAVAAGGSWQPAVDGLRPFTQDVWQAMSATDRARFLRHLRPWWDIHRHRLPGEVADRIAAARASGPLAVRAGRLRAFTERNGMVDATYQPRSRDGLATIRVARVVNCSGPGADYARIPHPLVRALLGKGLVRPDPLRLGLDVTGTCALLDRDGAISRRMFAAGPVTKGAFWEMTAVPDIRRQGEFLAEHLATLIRTAPKRLEPILA